MCNNVTYQNSTQFFFPVGWKLEGITFEDCNFRHIFFFSYTDMYYSFNLNLFSTYQLLRTYNIVTQKNSTFMQYTFQLLKETNCRKSFSQSHVPITLVLQKLHSNIFFFYFFYVFQSVLLSHVSHRHLDCHTYFTRTHTHPHKCRYTITKHIYGNTIQCTNSS